MPYDYIRSLKFIGNGRDGRDGAYSVLRHRYQYLESIICSLSVITQLRSHAQDATVAIFLPFDFKYCCIADVTNVFPVTPGASGKTRPSWTSCDHGSACKFCVLNADKTAFFPLSNTCLCPLLKTLIHSKDTLMSWSPERSMRSSL